MKFLWRALSLPLLLLPAALLLAVFTAPGTRNLIDAAAHVLPVEIDYGSGSLGGRLHLRRVVFESGTMRLQLEDVIAELSLPCLWRSALCFQQLQARNLDIALLPRENTHELPRGRLSDASNGKLIEFPVQLETDALELQALRVHWAGGEWRQGVMRGRVRLGHADVAILDAEVVEPRLVLHKTATDDSARADVTVMPVIDLPLALSVERVQLLRPSWELFGAARQLDAIDLQGRWLHRDLQLARLAVQDSDLGELSLHGAVTFADDWPLHADLAIDLAPSIISTEVLGRQILLSAEGDLAELALQLTCPGKLDVAVTGQVNVLQDKLPFTASVKATSAVPLPLAEIVSTPAALAGVTLESPFVATASGSLAAQHFDVQASASGLGYETLSVSMAGQHEAGLVTIADLSLRDGTGASALHGSGTVVLSEPLQWSLAVRSDGLDLPRPGDVDNSPRGRVDGKLHLTGDVQGQLWQVNVVDVALQGVINDLPARVTGFTGLGSGWRLAKSSLEADVNGAKLSLQSPGDDRGPGHLQLSVDDIGRWQPGSRGQVQLAATVSADRQRAQLTGSLQHVLWNGLAFDRGTLAGSYRADPEQSFTVSANVDDIALNDFKLTSLALSAQGNTARHTVTLASRGEIEGELRISGVLRDKQWQGRLAPTRLQTPIGPWQLPATVAMSWSDSTHEMTVAAHCWQHEHAQLCPGKAVLGRRGSISGELTGDMQLLASLLPPELEVAGELAARAAASWDPDAGINVQGRSQTRALTVTQEIGEGQSASFGWDAGDARFHYTRETLQLDWRLRQDNHTVLDLEVALPADKAHAMSGSLNIDQLQLAALAPFLPAFSALTGEVDGRVALSGTLDKPLGTGELKLSRGHLAVVGNPTELDGLELSLDLKGDWAQLSGTGRLGGGELQLDGRVVVSPSLQLEVSVTGNNHTVLYPPSTELQLSENLQLLLTRELLDISGDVTVQRGLLEFEQLPEDSVAVSASVVEVDNTGNSLAEKLPFKIRTDVRIHIDNQLKVTGKSLDTLLGGDLRVQQRPGQPLLLFGNLNTIGGEVRAYQSRLQITRGTINFTGPPANPMLDVNAERHITGGDVTVGVHVQGPLEDELLLEIYTTPAMSQAEAISYLVRGRGLDAGAGVDGTAAALALASGVVNRSTLVSELNRVPGLSQFEFGAQGGESDTAATVSGYLGERLYLSYGIGLYEPINVLTSRFYLRARLWVEVVSSLENSVDLYYSFDLD